MTDIRGEILKRIAERSPDARTALAKAKDGCQCGGDCGDEFEISLLTVRNNEHLVTKARQLCGTRVLKGESPRYTVEGIRARNGGPVLVGIDLGGGQAVFGEGMLDAATGTLTFNKDSGRVVKHSIQGKHPRFVRFAAQLADGSGPAPTDENGLPNSSPGRLADGSLMKANDVATGILARAEERKR